MKPRLLVWLSVAGLAVVSQWGCRKGSQETAAPAPALERGPAAVVLQVYAPCGLEGPFMELETLFEKDHPGTDLNLLLDNAHILAERILDQGERPDIVVSPGGHELSRLIAAGLIKVEDVHPFSPLDLCLFVPRANTAGVNSMEDLAKESVKVLAVADPEKTSIGHFTVEALTKAGLWERVRGKVVFTGDASQTYKHVASGKADASFAYRSCPLKTAPDKMEYAKVRVIQSVPSELYGPANVTLAVMANSPRRDLADAFVKLLFSETGRAVLDKFEMPCVAGETGAGAPQKAP